MGAQAPIDHFGFVDCKAVILSRLKAGGMASRAVDIDRRVASAADEMVMVVSRPRLIQSRPSGGLDPLEKAASHERVEVVVDRLARELAQPFAGGIHDKVGIAMLPLVVDHLQDRHPGSGQS